MWTKVDAVQIVKLSQQSFCHWWQNIHYHLAQGWAISGPRATCGPPQRFQWPAKAFRKNLQI